VPFPVGPWQLPAQAHRKRAYPGGQHSDGHLTLTLTPTLSPIIIQSIIIIILITQPKPQPKRIENARILVANTAMDTDKVKIYGARVRTDSMAKVRVSQTA